MYQVDQWQPTASLAVLQQRARLLQCMRHFFDQRNVMEVDTQSLSLASITDPHIEVLTTQTQVAGQATTYYLQTSPEFAMKRLLCAGAGSIYQLAKVYRAEDLGRRHAIEFTLLEWYRVGLDHWQLMDEIEQLLQAVTQDAKLKCESLSYQQAFERHLGINPHQVDLLSLQTIAHQHTEYGLEETDRDTLLELLFSHVIEDAIGLEQPCFIHSYPASQAALAKTHQQADGAAVAARFELYWQGMELANGYHELTDPQEQARRFEFDENARSTMGLATRLSDRRLISGLQQGLPECAGVALGVDRLLMLLSQQAHIDQVIPFAGHTA